MKITILLFYFLFISINTFSQTPWKEITQKATTLEAEEKWEEALTLRRSAVNAAISTNENTRLYLKALETITQAELTLINSNDYKLAYDLMLGGTEDLIASGAEPFEISKVYRRLGMISHNYFRDMEGAYSHTLKSVEYHQKSKEKDTTLLSKTFHSLGVLSRQLGRFKESIGHFGKFITVYNNMAVKDTNMLGATYRDLSMVYSTRFLNIPAKQSEYLILSKDTFETLQEPNLQYLLVVYMELGILETEMGNFRKAEGFFNKGIQLYRDNKEETQLHRKGDIGNAPEITYNTNLVGLFSAAKNEEEVLNALANVEDIEKNNKLKNYEYDLYVSCLNLVGDFFAKEQPERALTYFNKAFQAHQKQKERDLTPNINTNLATAYFHKNDYKKALSLLESVENNPDIEVFTRKKVFALKSETFFYLGETVAGIDELQKLITEISPENFDIKTGNIQDYNPGYNLIDARYYLTISSAIDAPENSLKIIKENLLWLALIEFENNIGSNPLNKNLKKTFDEITSGLINVALERQFTAEENNRLLNFMERVPSQNLINQYLLKREIAGNTQAYKLVEEEQYIRSYITFLKKEYQKSKEENIQQQLFEKEIQLENISERLTTQYKNNNPFTSPEVDVTTVTDKNIIKFVTANNQLFKIRLHNGKLTYQKIADYPTLKQDIKDYLVSINDLNISVGELKEQGETLYKKLFTDEFSTTHSAVIIPDDVLHYLPFELLVRNNEYLIENHTISYASNFYFLNTKTTIENISKNKKVAFFAPEYSGSMPESQLAVRGDVYSLAGAKEEVHQLATFIPGNIYVGNAASKSNFKALNSDISVLHLAMHSNLNDNDPELSNLMFSDSEEDYEMYISELYGLNFNADLAVLSACNTGVGGFKDGGNLVSMHHAFNTIGIPATIASLWNAPDLSTKEIMVTFYKNLQQGQDKATSLRNAKLSYLKNTPDKNLQHPFYWAGFVLSGDMSPVQLATTSSWPQYAILWASIGLMLIIFLYFFIRKKTQNPI